MCKDLKLKIPQSVEIVYADDPSGKQDFIRNGPIRYVFEPSSVMETGSIDVLFNDDSINEADEGFFLFVDIEKNSQNIVILKGGLALVVLEDEDCKSQELYSHYL